MKDNKHPHHDLIVEWAKDTSKVVQVRFERSNWNWNDTQTPFWRPDGEYRLKPREFKSGNWYPCITKNGKRKLYMYIVHLGFVSSQDNKGNDVNGYPVDSMRWVGESLGEIDFPE